MSFKYTFNLGIQTLLNTYTHQLSFWAQNMFFINFAGLFLTKLFMFYNYRSVTPTELRRRHLSSNSSLDFDFLDPLIHCKEIEMPKYVSNFCKKLMCVKIQLYYFHRNFIFKIASN